MMTTLGRLTAKNALLCIGAAFLLWWAASSAVAAISGRSIYYSGLLGFYFMVLASWLLLLYAWFVGRRNRGAVLLDCGTHSLSFSPLQLCEGGIWHNFNLLPWSKIESYYWNDNTTFMVTMRPSALFFFSRRGAYRVPGGHQPAVEQLLSQLVTKPVQRAGRA